MAEFCVDCFNKMMGITDSARKYHISKELDLCEECGEYKRVIVCIKRRYLIAECIRDIWDYRVKKKSYGSPTNLRFSSTPDMQKQQALKAKPCALP